MSLSPQGEIEIITTSSTVAWLTLLTFWLPSDPALDPIRVCNDNLPFVSRGQTFLPVPFDIQLPADNGEQLPTVKIQISNVSEIIEAIRGYPEAPRVKLEIVMNITPDTVERAIDFLRLNTVSYDAIQITGDLTVEDVLHSGFPRERYTAVNFPGLIV